MADRVRVEFRGHLAYVTLSRPEKMNAVDSDMIEALIQAAADIRDTDARAVILSGEGKAFCAGLDFMSFSALAQQQDSDWLLERSHGDCNGFQAVALAWHDLPIPVIAALHGVVFGAGLQIALGADIRLAEPATQLAIMEMKWGLIPDMGGMVLLPRLVRSDVLRLLTYTADPITAEQARDWGLVTQIHENAYAAAEDMAHKIAAKGPNAVKASKRLISFAESGAPRETVLLRESEEQSALIGQKEQISVVSAELKNRGL